MKSKIVMCMLALSLLVAAPLFGQATANSSLQGTVTDATGAAVVGADVTVTNAATGLARSTK